MFSRYLAAFSLLPVAVDAFTVVVPEIRSGGGIYSLKNEYRSSSTSCSSIVEGESVTEVEEFDEDDFDFESVFSYNDYLERLQQLARITSKDPTAVEQALQVFDDMYQAYVMTEDASLFPNTEIFNLILEVHAYSPSLDGAKEAERILERMEDPSDQDTPSPNLQTYAKVIEAYGKRHQPDKAQKIMNRLATNSDLQPNTYIYNKLIRAYGMAGDAAKAESILKEMMEASEGDKESPLRPDQKTWVHVLRAYASRQHKDTSVEMVGDLMRRMEKGYRQGHEDWKPGVEAFNAQLKALSHQKRSAKEAENVLYGMIEHFKEGDEDMRPNADSFANVINAYRGETDKGVAFKVEKLIELQEAMVEGADDSLKPNARTYNAAMAAMSRARDPRKAQRSKRFMDRMIRRYEEGDDSCAPSFFTYKSLLNACAYTNGGPEDKLVAFQIAVNALNELQQSSSLEPDHSFYGLFLRACGNLMPSNRKRDAVVESVFTRCCKDGLTSEYVLKVFEKAASAELQLKILGGFLEDGVQPPAEWSRNVVDK